MIEGGKLASACSKFRGRVDLKGEDQAGFPAWLHVATQHDPFSMNIKTVHIAEMIAEGGRDGRVEAAEGGFRVELSSGERPCDLTPEHLFAGAYASCFLGALKSQAEAAHFPTEGITLVARAHLDEDARGQYNLNVDLRAAIPGVNKSDAKHLMNLAHQSCPYSKATRGNITVNLSFD